MSESDGLHLGRGIRVARYEVVEVLGAGGFGITYKVVDTRLQCEAAMKEYLPAEYALRSSDQTTVLPRSEALVDEYQHGLTRFLDEARVLAKFKNRHIVRVSDYMEVNGTAYLVMDYEEGQSLSSLLKERGGNLSEAEIKNIFIPILDGLKVVHDAGLLHRDIKPDNIYLRREGPPVLLDFGAARQYTASQTKSVTAIVTPGYAPFEQYQQNPDLGAWTDLYAIGATMYACIAGAPPLDAITRHAGTKADPLPPAVEVGGDRYSEILLRSVDWMLRPAITERPQSVEEVLPCIHGRAEPPEFVLASATVPASVVAPTLRAGATGGEAPTVMRGSTDRSTGIVAPARAGSGGRVGLIAVVVAAVAIGAGGFWWYSQDRGTGEPDTTQSGVQPAASQTAEAEADPSEPPAAETATAAPAAETTTEETAARAPATEAATQTATTDAPVDGTTAGDTTSVEPAAGETAASEAEPAAEDAPAAQSTAAGIAETETHTAEPATTTTTTSPETTATTTAPADAGMGSTETTAASAPAGDAPVTENAATARLAAPETTAADAAAADAAAADTAAADTAAADTAAADAAAAETPATEEATKSVTSTVATTADEPAASPADTTAAATSAAEPAVTEPTATATSPAEIAVVEGAATDETSRAPRADTGTTDAVADQVGAQAPATGDAETAAAREEAGTGAADEKVTENVDEFLTALIPESSQPEPGGTAAGEEAGAGTGTEEVTENVDEFLTALMLESSQSEPGGSAAGQAPGNLEDLLKQADAYLAASSLILPERSNARTIYERVLALDADNPRALAGMNRIGNVYERAAEVMLAEGRPSMGLQIVSRGLAAVPNHAGLQRLKSRLEAQ